MRHIWRYFIKYILLVSFILFPVIANAEATGGYSFGNALDRLAALILGPPIAGVIGAIVFSLTLKKLFYPGILKYFLGLIDGIIGMLLSIWILNDDRLFEGLISSPSFERSPPHSEQPSPTDSTCSMRSR